MKKRHLTKLLAIVLAATMSVGVLPITVSATSSLDQVQNKKQQLAEKLDDLQGKNKESAEYQAALDEQIVVMQQEIDIYQSQEDNLNSEISAKEAQISQLNSQLLDTQREVDEKNAEIEQKEQEKQKTIDQLKERMVADYKAGQTTTLDLLLTADDFGEFMASMEYIKRIAKHDQDLVETLTQQVEEINQNKKEVEIKLSELETQKSDLEAQLDEVRIQYDEASSVRASKEAAQADLNAKKQQSIQYQGDIQQEIQEIEEQYENAGQPNGTNQIETGTISGSGYMWPVPGRAMGDGYGSRVLNGKVVNHWGIDIPAPLGTNICAAKSGTVVVSLDEEFNKQGSGYGGYGSVVVIQHDDGYYTLYAHASALLAYEGQRVEQGQVIAKVGHSGQAYGNHLHFEVRDRTKEPKTARKLNPLNFVSPS